MPETLNDRAEPPCTTRTACDGVHQEECADAAIEQHMQPCGELQVSALHRQMAWVGRGMHSILVAANDL